jgi:hypothetical protein
MSAARCPTVTRPETPCIATEQFCHKERDQMTPLGMTSRHIAGPEGPPKANGWKSKARRAAGRLSPHVIGPRMDGRAPAAVGSEEASAVAAEAPGARSVCAQYSQPRYADQQPFPDGRVKGSTTPQMAPSQWSVPPMFRRSLVNARAIARRRRRRMSRMKSSADNVEAR